MKFDPFIEAEKAAGHSVKRACELCKVSRSAFYERVLIQPSKRDLDDAKLTQVITTVFDESLKTYGSPRVHQALCRLGHHVGKKRVERLMTKAGLVGRCRRKFKKTTVQDPTTAPSTIDYIKRDFAIGEINKRWCGDITYIRTNEGWLYLATVIDLGSRKIIGWAMADHMKTSLVTDALSMAYESRCPATGVIFHSDRGIQYTSNELERFAVKHKIMLSLGRKGECWDNAVAESFFASLKDELVDRYIWPTKAQAQAAIFRYIEHWFNRTRLHSSLGYQSPNEYELLLTSTHQPVSV